MLLVVYTVLVGASASVVRACIMSVMVILAGMLGRQSYALNALAMSALVMTAINPYTLWDAGFLLSAGATLGLLLYSEPLTRRAERLLRRVCSETVTQRILAIAGDSLLVTTAAQITTIPYIAYTFRRAAPISFIVNFFALPAQPPLEIWGGAAVLLGMLWLPAGQALGAIAWLPAAWTTRTVLFFAQVPGASVALDYVSPEWTWAYYVVLFGLTALPGDWRARAASAIKANLRATTLASALGVVALLAWTAVPALPDGRLHVTMLSVEDGSAVLIVTPAGARILVDGGPKASTTLSQLGRRLPWWQRRIDLVIATHPKPERLNGLLAVLERYDVGQAITNGQDPKSPAYAQWREALAARRVPNAPAQDGARLVTEDGVTLTLLNAVPVGGDKATPDDASLVLHVQYGGVSFLLPSDITEKREALLAASVPHADVLLAGRNGAGDATSDAWLAAVAPSAVAISVQPDTRALLPAPETLERLTFYEVWRTDEHGAIEFVTDGEGLSVRMEH